MIDWNKRNGGFLSPESVYEDQLGNLSMQINNLQQQLDKYKNVIDKIKEYIEKHIACMKNGNVLAEFNIDELCELLEEVE